MENAEEAQRFLAGYGWQASPEPHFDKRVVHPLAEVTDPPRSPRPKSAKSPPSRPRSRQEAFSNRARLSTIHLTRELNKLTGGFRTLDGGSSLAAGSVESDKAELLLKQEERIKKFNALGVFKPSVSVIRARAMYHVDLARRLKSVDINKRLSAKPESKPEKEAPLIAAPPPPGLHNKLDRILTDFTLAAPPQNPSFRAVAQRFVTRRATTLRRATRRKTGLAKEPSALDLIMQEKMKQLVDNVHARTQEATRQAKAEIVARYRTRVLDVEKKVLESAEQTRLARFASEYRGKASADSGGMGSKAESGGTRLKVASEGLGSEPAIRREGLEEGLEEGLRRGLEEDLKEEGVREGLEGGLRGFLEREGNEGMGLANGGSTSKIGLVSTSENAEEGLTGAVVEQSVTDKAQKGLRDGRVADRSYSRSRSRQKERSEERIAGRRMSLRKGVLEGGEAPLPATNAATDLIERAGRLAQREEQASTVRRVKRETDERNERNGSHSPCFRTRTAQAWAALESSLPSSRLAGQAEWQNSAGTAEFRTEQYVPVEERDISDELERREYKGEDQQETDEIAGTTQESCISDAPSEDTDQVVLEGSDSVPADSERNAVAAEEEDDTTARADMASVAEVLEARLERVWEVLGTATAAKIEMVIKYTSRGHSHQLEEAVQCWEDAAAAILAHERAMRDWEDAYPALYEPTSVAAEAELLMEQVRVAQAIIESAARAAEYIQALKSTFVDELLVHGRPYQSRLQEAASVEKVMKGLENRRKQLDAA